MIRREGKITEKRENRGTCLMPSNEVGWTKEMREKRKETTKAGLMTKVIDGNENE